MRPPSPPPFQLEDEAQIQQRFTGDFVLRFTTALGGVSLRNYMELRRSEGFHGAGMPPLEEDEIFLDFWLLCDTNPAVSAVLLCPDHEIVVMDTDDMCEILDRLSNYVYRHLGPNMVPIIFVVCGGDFSRFQRLREICHTKFTTYDASGGNRIRTRCITCDSEDVVMGYNDDESSRGEYCLEHLPTSHTVDGYTLLPRRGRLVVLGLDCLSPTVMKMTASLWDIGTRGGYLELFTLNCCTLDPLLPYAAAVVQAQALFSSELPSQNSATLDSWRSLVGNFAVVSDDSHSGLLQPFTSLFEWCFTTIAYGDFRQTDIYQYRTSGNYIFQSTPRAAYHQPAIVQEFKRLINDQNLIHRGWMDRLTSDHVQFLRNLLPVPI